MITNATPDQIPAIAKLWHDGWYEAHETIVPKALTRLRTLDSFETRTAVHLPETRVATSGETLRGFCMVQSDELYQLYVSPTARGTGTAQDLVKDAEAEIANRGHKTAWLACAIGNSRAAQFYESCGWVNMRSESIDLETSEGPFAMEIWRFEKTVADS